MTLWDFSLDYFCHKINMTLYRDCNATVVPSSVKVFIFEKLLALLWEVGGWHSYLFCRLTQQSVTYLKFKSAIVSSFTIHNLIFLCIAWVRKAVAVLLSATSEQSVFYWACSEGHVATARDAEHWGPPSPAPLESICRGVKLTSNSSVHTSAETHSKTQDTNTYLLLQLVKIWLTRRKHFSLSSQILY